jgi:YD repeat-containing protein
MPSGLAHTVLLMNTIGNIPKETDINNNVTQYIYDRLNQLVRSNDQKNNVSNTYDYDTSGNITGTSSYVYTIGDLGTPIDNTTTTYTYGDSDWRDLLTHLFAKFRNSTNILSMK